MNDILGLSSALGHFAKIERQLAGKQLGIFLDYDGTLTPIVDRPELAVLSDEMRRLLDKLSGRCATAIISGRALQELKELVRVDNLFYAGSHGFDIVGPPGSGIQHEVGKEFVPAIEGARLQLCAQLDSVPGVIIETKRYSLSVHYRLVEERRVPSIDQVLDRVLARHPTLYKTHGKKVFEVRPKIDWNKGEAVQWILRTLGFSTAAVPFYIGDDTTDEDAFQAIAGTGIGILVGKDPRPTAAIYGLEDPEEVGLFLERMLSLLSNGGRER